MLLQGTLLLLVSVIRADEEYFIKTNFTTWNDARQRCQECYKELTTITPANAQLLAQLVAANPDLVYWIGLRQNLNGSIPWSRWANGAAVVYQNWYPGHPVLETKPVPSPQCPAPSINCSVFDHCPTLAILSSCLNTLIDITNCTGDFPIENDTVSTLFGSGMAFFNTAPTILNISPSVTNSCLTSSFSTEKDSEFINNSCVAMFGSGMWQEKHCNSLLPYICYDDRFYGQVNVSNVTEAKIYLSWSMAPGLNISHYRVEIIGQQPTNVSAWVQQINNAVTERNFRISDLSAWNRTEILENTPTDEHIMAKQVEMLVPGTFYTVHIVAVRCNRRLNPQNASFYTLPQQVINLTVLKVKSNEIDLTWTKPYGGLEFYSVNVSNMPSLKQTTEKCTVSGLEPGTFYHIQVSAVVNKTSFGLPDSTEVYTKPSPVINFISFNNESDKIIAFWNSTDLNHQHYLYNINLMGNNTQTNKNTVTLGDLEPGTKYTLIVSALANGTVEGEAVTISAYTMPMTVKGLYLECTEDSITAYWNLPKGNFTYFRLCLFSSMTSPVNVTTTRTNYMFTNLRAALLYNVTVTTYVDVFPSLPAHASNYTFPVGPGPATVTNINSTAVNLSWIVPSKLEGVKYITYRVKYFSSFWHENGSHNVTETNYIIITGLRPGTRYNYNISVIAGEMESLPSKTCGMTVANKRSLTLTMLCSSATQLNCMKNDTMEAILEKLRTYIKNAYNEDIAWSIKWKDK